MHFAAWNKSTYVDLLVLTMKVLVAAALIAHAHHIRRHLHPEPVYGVLNKADYTYSVQETADILVTVSWTAGGYVLISSAIGLLGRFLRAAPLYGVYYCANVFGFGVCLAAAIVPALWGTSKSGYCLAAEDSCMSVEDLSECPYPVTLASESRVGRLAEDETDFVAAAASGEGLTSSSPCCYLPELIRFCGSFLGAVYTQTIIAVVLLALVMTQSMVSCCYLCCDCDRPWTAKGRLPAMTDLTAFTMPEALPRRSRALTTRNDIERKEVAEEGNGTMKEGEEQERKAREGGGRGRDEEKGSKGRKEGGRRGSRVASSASAAEEGMACATSGAGAATATRPPGAITPAAAATGAAAEAGSAQGTAAVTEEAAAAAAAAGLTSAAIHEKERNEDYPA